MYVWRGNYKLLKKQIRKKKWRGATVKNKALGHLSNVPNLASWHQNECTLTFVLFLYKCMFIRGVAGTSHYAAVQLCEGEWEDVSE